jgi:hypothetical protein
MPKLNKAQKLMAEIHSLGKKLAEHQAKCKHPKVQKVAGSNTGNWCNQDDSYWYDCFCPTCLKRWREDQ